jgi:uncharacterized protein (DUF2252 family)
VDSRPDEAAAGQGRARRVHTNASAPGRRTAAAARRSAGRPPLPHAVPLVVPPVEPLPEFVQLSVGKRVVLGRAARRDAPRASHGAWHAAPDRPDPVALLQSQDETRVPELVPIRYGRMLVSPFTFFRGAALVMAADLAPTPRSGLTVQLCGDAHVLNFGLFGSPERQVIFDVNDFDETLPGPWEWDVKRLAASLEIAGRDRGFEPSARRDIVTAAVREYRDVMRRAAEMPALDVWYAHMNADDVVAWMQTEVREKRLGRREAKEGVQDVAKARTRDSMHVFAKRTGIVDDELQIVAEPPLIVPIEDLVLPGTGWEDVRAVFDELIHSYRQTLMRRRHPIEEFRYLHSARKVVGVGSVGTRAWIHLFVGRDDEDPLFLQSKEAQASVLERFVGKSPYDNHAQRVVVGQRLMQAASDIFLGFLRVRGIDGVNRDYYVRQLHDWKGGIDVETLRVPGATLYGRMCAGTLARAHARLGDRIAIASYLGKGDAFDRALADFSVAYADQNERDYAAFAKAVKKGRVTAETGL